MKRIRIAPAVAISLIAACTASFAAYAADETGTGDVPESAAPVIISETVTPEITAMYGVPLEADLQAAIIDICDEYKVDSAIVFAMMDVESDYDIYALGDSGDAYGIMQVQRRYHYDRMARLGCWDLYDPVQCVTVAADYLTELLDKYEGDMSMALTAYNRGSYGAQRDLFSKGVYESDYSREVLTIAQTLAEGVTTCVYPR